MKKCLLIAPRRAMPAVKHGGLLLFFIIVWGCAACASVGDPPPVPAADKPSSANASEPVAAIVRADDLAFHADGAAWKASSGGYTARATAHGFELAPIHRVTARPPRAASVAAGAPARFSTTAVRRGDRAIGGAARPRLDPDGHLALDRGELIEHLQNRLDGVELSYSFARRPGGSGDLTVRIAASGQPYSGETPRGHHFADATTSLGVCFGPAVWIDARGRRTAVPTARVDGGLELRVPADAIDTSAYPAVLDPLVSPEIGMDEPLFGAASEAQTEPAIAFGDSQSLVVWTDRRTGDDSPTLYAARFTAGGAVLDPFGFPVAAGHSPAIGYDGTRFLVVYQTGFGTNASLRGARVEPTGTVVDPGGFLIAAGTTRGTPSIVFTGASYLVAWSYDAPEGLRPHLASARVTPGGEVLDPGGVVFEPAEGLLDANHPCVPKLAFDGTNVLLAWVTDRVYGARLGPHGETVDTVAFAVTPPLRSRPADLNSIAAAYDGTDHVIVWTDTDASYDSHVYATRVTPQGGVVDPDGILIGTSDEITDVAVVFDGTDSVIGWDTGLYEGGDGTVHVGWLQSDGTVLDGSGVAVGGGGQPALASGVDGAVIAWSRSGSDTSSSPSSDIAAARLSAAGYVIDAPGVLVSKAANAQRRPAAAFDGRSALVVWEDERDDNTPASRGLYGALVSPAGVVGPTSIPIATGTGWHFDPLVVASDSAFVVLWHYNTDRGGKGDGGTWLLSRAVSPDGSPLSPDPYVVPGSLTLCSTGRVAAAWNGTSLLVVQPTCPEERPAVMQALLLDTHGTLAGTPVDLDIRFPQGIEAQVASDGAGFLMVWVDGDELLGARLGPRGETLDPGGFVIATNLGYTALPALAFDGENYLVVWASGDAQIVGARVSPREGLLDAQGFVLTPGPTPGNATRPSVAFTEGRYLVTYGVYGTTAGSIDLLGVEVSHDGGLLSTFPISTAPQDEGAAAVVAVGGGDALVAYARFVAEPPFSAYRVEARVIDLSGCREEAECATGFCVDGVCCDSACGDGDPDDCLACSAAAGAPEDGRCAPRGDVAECMSAGVCQDVTCSPGQGCSGSAKPDGTACEGGECVAGECTPSGDLPAGTDTSPVAFGGCGCLLGAIAPTAAWPAGLAASVVLAAARLRRRGHGVLRSTRRRSLR